MTDLAYPHLHPTIKLVNIQNGALQIRTPDGLHLTLEANPKILKRILSLCDGTNSHLEIVEKVQQEFPQVSSKYLSSLFSLLAQKKILNEYDKSDLESSDSFHQAMNFFGKTIKSGFQMLQPTTNGKYLAKIDTSSIQIEGRGLVAKAAKEVAKQLNIEVVSSTNDDDNSKTLVLACADSEDISYFRELNNKYVGEQKRPMAFAYINDMNFMVGPLVIPGESACFECLFRRKLVNVAHLREFEAYMDHCEENRNGAQVESAVLSSFAYYAVSFLLGGIKNSVFNFIEPGRLMVFNMSNMETEKHRITKLPRCTVCGLSAKHRAPQAIRNIV